MQKMIGNSDCTWKIRRKIKITIILVPNRYSRKISRKNSWNQYLIATRNIVHTLIVVNSMINGSIFLCFRRLLISYFLQKNFCRCQLSTFGIPQIWWHFACYKQRSWYTNQWHSENTKWYSIYFYSVYLHSTVTYCIWFPYCRSNHVNIRTKFQNQLSIHFFHYIAYFKDLQSILVFHARFCKPLPK